MHKQLMNV